MSSRPPSLTVVAAVIVTDGSVLLTQRPGGAHLEHFWEFPGGKVEPGESPSQALRRELREELGIETEVGDPFTFSWHDYGEKRVLLLAYRTRIVSGEPRPIGCIDLGWFSADGIRGLQLPPADGPILKQLLPVLERP
jgi:mutator protein MutT